MSPGQKLADPVSLSLSLFREVEDVVAYASDGRPHRTEASKPYPRGDPSFHPEGQESILFYAAELIPVI